MKSGRRLSPVLLWAHTILVLVSCAATSSSAVQDSMGDAGPKNSSAKDASGPFVAEEQYLGESKTWHSVLSTVRQNGDLSPRKDAVFQLISINASFDSDVPRPAVPGRVTIGFEYRPCHQREPWIPKVTLYADEKYVCDLTLRGELCSGGPGRETEFGRAEIQLADLERWAAGKNLVVRVDEIETQINPRAADALRWYVDWQLGEEVPASLARQPKLAAALQPMHPALLYIRSRRAR